MAVFTAQPGGVEQVQAFDTLRVIYGEARGDPTSQRIAHEGYLRIAQSIEKAPDIENMCADIETFWSDGRFAKTRQIRRIDQILFAQAWHQQGPRFGRGPKAMNKDQGSTSSTGVVIVDRKAINLTGCFTHAPEEHSDASHTCHGLNRTSIECRCQRHPSSRQCYKGWKGRKPGKRVLGCERHKKSL